MAGSEFFQTSMGKRFYQGTMPRIADSLEQIADSLEQIAKSLENMSKDKDPDSCKGHIWRPHPADDYIDRCLRCGKERTSWRISSKTRRHP